MPNNRPKGTVLGCIMITTPVLFLFKHTLWLGDQCFACYEPVQKLFNCNLEEGARVRFVLHDAFVPHSVELQWYGTISVVGSYSSYYYVALRNYLRGNVPYGTYFVELIEQ